MYPPNAFEKLNYKVLFVDGHWLEKNCYFSFMK